MCRYSRLAGNDFGASIRGAGKIVGKRPEKEVFEWVSTVEMLVQESDFSALYNELELFEFYLREGLMWWRESILFFVLSTQKWVNCRMRVLLSVDCRVLRSINEYYRIPSVTEFGQVSC